MSEFRIDQIKSQDASRGPDVAGITTFTGTSGIVMPSGDTAHRGGRGRAVFARGYIDPAPSWPAVDITETVMIPTLGNAIEWGELVNNAVQIGGASNSTRGIFAGGSPNETSVMNIASGGVINYGESTSSCGGLTIPRRGTATCSDTIRAFFAGGQQQSAPACGTHHQTTSYLIDYFLFESLGKATSFGDLTQNRRQLLGGFSSPTRGVFCGGYDGDNSPYARYNNIDYITMSTTGNVQDFGDLTEARSSSGGLSNSTRGMVAGGWAQTPSDVDRKTIDYVTIASTGNAQDFGDLINTSHNRGGSSTSTRGIFAGGYNRKSPAPSTTGLTDIDYITIASTGNGTDFGDLVRAGACGNDGGISDSHGGLG
jgi:hypothetical protein